MAIMAIMIIVDSCMIWFHFDCIMELRKSYHFATNVCSRKSATTFGDIPDCSSGMATFVWCLNEARHLTAIAVTAIWLKRKIHQEPILQTWFNFNPSMDK